MEAAICDDRALLMSTQVIFLRNRPCYLPDVAPLAEPALSCAEMGDVFLSVHFARVPELMLDDAVLYV